METIVFSSSATVYGDPVSVPIAEDAALDPTNPYGQTKRFSDQFIRDRRVAHPRQRAALLRYFNPAGATRAAASARPPGGPSNLMPYITAVAQGRLPHLRMFGDDYPTVDGTGVRDYIHVIDLARGHLAALDTLADPPRRIRRRWIADRQSGHGTRLFRPRGGEGIRTRKWRDHSVRGRCWPAIRSTVQPKARRSHAIDTPEKGQLTSPGRFCTVAENRENPTGQTTPDCTGRRQSVPVGGKHTNHRRTAR